MHEQKRLAPSTACHCCHTNYCCTAGLYHTLVLPVLQVLTLGSMLPHTTVGTAVRTLGLLASTRSWRNLQGGCGTREAV
jgi:hypothetical protein